MKDNLKDYESVKTRKKRFYQDYPDGRIIVEHIKIDSNEAVFKCCLYKNIDEQIKSMPLATGYAQEFKGQGGFANKFSWSENCEESAIGRALDNAGYATNEKCSREEMLKVYRHEEMEKQLREVQEHFGKLLSVKADGEHGKTNLLKALEIDRSNKDIEYWNGKIEQLKSM